MATLALSVFVPTSRAETRCADHAWVIGSDGNYYGLVQWDDSTPIGSGSKPKRTVIYLGSHEFTVYQPAPLVATAALFWLSSLVLIPFSIRRKKKA
jgi:hypothetical protein